MRDLRARLSQIDGARAAGGPSVRSGRAREGAGFEMREQHIDLAELALTVNGRGDPEPGLLAHLGLRGEPPRRWEDIVFLDTETTGLSGGTGTYEFLLGRSLRAA